MMFSNIDVLGADGSICVNQYVGIRDRRIDYVGEKLPDKEYGRNYDGRGKLLLPGFVNAHCHVPMTLMRGYGERLPLGRWLNERIFPFEAQLDGDAVYYGSLLGIAEMFQAGITSFTEMYCFCEDIARAVLETGISCNLSRGLTCFNDLPLSEQAAFDESRQLYETYHGAHSGQLLVDMCIHGEYTSTPRVVREMADYARSIGSRMHVHVSETRKEHEECIERHGKTPAAYFDGLGLFDVPATAAHCVYISDLDMDILREKGVTVAHCPASNMKLGSGIAPVYALFKKGVRVALGTDGVASNNNFDMIKEMRLAAFLQNGSLGDPSLLSPADVLHMATKTGAQGQGRTDTGEIAPGKIADLVVADCTSVNMTPCYDKAVNFVYSSKSSDIKLTMCRGRIVYENGDFPGMDIEQIQSQVTRILAKISQ